MRTLFALWLIGALGLAANAPVPRERSFSFGYGPLNDFVYPCVELDGGKYTSVATSYSYKDLPLRWQQQP